VGELNCDQSTLMERVLPGRNETGGRRSRERILMGKTASPERKAVDFRELRKNRSHKKYREKRFKPRRPGRGTESAKTGSTGKGL